MFSKRLRELRKAAHLTQKQLAEKMYVDQTSISFWETGKARPDFDKQIELAELFDVSLDYLRGKTDIKKEAPTLEQVDAKELQRLKELVEHLTPEQQEELLRYGQYLASQPPFSKDS